MKLQLEELLSQLGNPGRYQKVIFLLLALNYLPVVFNHVIMAFFGSAPKHQCYSEFYESIMDSQQMTSGNLTDNSSMTTNQSFIVDKQLKECRAEYLFQSWQNVSVVCGAGGAGKLKYYKEPKETTIVTEWNLVCDFKYQSSLATTIYFCGVMFGGMLFGHIADKFGRRLVMLLTLYMPILVGVGIAFAPWYSLFAALRFIQGLLMQGLQTSTYTLAMELFLPKYRSHAGVLLECFWGFGVMLLPALAYLIQDWRYLQLAVSLPSILALGYICIMPESLRWLIMMGKVDKAEALITKITEENKLPYPYESWEDVKLQMGTRNADTKQYSFIDLMHTPVLRKRSLILFYLWFATSIGYYGLTWKLTKMAGNKYLNFFIGGAVEFVAYVLVLPVTKRFGRRRPLCFYFILAATMCITAGGLMFQMNPSQEMSWATTAFAIAGKFGMGGIFCVIFLYTSELYPTVIRNIGMGNCAFWTRLGGVIAPQILLLDQFANKAGPLVLFGVVTLLGGLLTMLLPETRGRKLPDTVEDVENSCSSIADEQFTHICKDTDNVEMTNA